MSIKNAGVLAIDLGRATGWAAYGITNQNTLLSGGTYDLGKGAELGVRLKALYQFLEEKRKIYNGLQSVYYEKVRSHKGIQAAHAYGAYEGVLMLWGLLRNVYIIPEEVGTIKKYATGNGRATKGQMEAAYTARVGRIPVDDNAADAFFILALALERDLCIKI